jgi:hypothetical protein
MNIMDPDKDVDLVVIYFGHLAVRRRTHTVSNDASVWTAMDEPV